MFNELLGVMKDQTRAFFSFQKKKKKTSAFLCLGW